MAARPPFVLHQPTHHHLRHAGEHDAHPHQARLPAIPDLRFEHSYLRSIQRYVTIHRRQPSDSVLGEKEESLRQLSTTSSNISSEVIDIQWGRVAWITTRDQIISPLLQGALWALASYFLTPFSAQLGTRVGKFARSNLSLPKEGSGVGWLRGWVSGLGASGTSVAATRRQ
ncbi:hypothetical protein D9615_006071 [Tricholomella constricta]|uniref:Uncharacterized protein n=1 Tax=Tricholomella constricta TaxID=117010 RepID=A0A8H5H993_9AGAR|nr:hypothetical protein D9615_006071 [Tricholomella constricta]